MNVGFLHPGLMGETLAANCSAVSLWAAQGRSQETRERADAHGLTEVADIESMCSQSEMIVSICPPAAAVDVADQVAAAGFGGIYVDANAISPQSARAIATKFARYVDGSVIGPPAHAAGTTRLYLSGPQADQVASLYAGSVLEARVIGDEPVAASALKMAYASWTKIGSALHLAIRALAHAEGVEDALVNEWSLSQPWLGERSERIAAGVGPKAWRFTGEMKQIAQAFASIDAPTGFADAANEIYERMAGFKGAPGPSLDAVIDAISQG